MPSTEEIHAYIELALAFHEGSHFGPPPSLADIARDYLTRTARALRVVRALEAGIPVPRWLGEYWVFVSAPKADLPPHLRDGPLHEWIQTHGIYGSMQDGKVGPHGPTYWRTLTDAVLAASDACGLEE